MDKEFLTWIQETIDNQLQKNCKIGTLRRQKVLTGWNQPNAGKLADVNNNNNNNWGAVWKTETVYTYKIERKL